MRKNPELHKALSQLYKVNQEMRDIEFKRFSAAYTDENYLQLKVEKSNLEAKIKRLRDGR